MRTDTAAAINLADYAPADFLIDTVRLDVVLERNATVVTADLALRRNPAGRGDAPLVLDGDELVLVSAALDGQPLAASAFTASAQAFHLHAPPSGTFTLRLVTQLDPAANTKLMGLYRSGAAYCTQCEAEGFRRITYFLDRPDVMSVYTVRIEADRSDAPILLSNGNPVERGSIAGGNRHFAIWHDPHPKPAYLFALVGGDLDVVADSFVTVSGRTVDLGIYVERGKAARCDWAMDSLKRSMRWDETAFGCEYDLDVFNIVAVSDFNMGAMENKGLNVFNDRYILADAQTATDVDYDNIEAIIAHEYFHNWTGNRITCRDWFQLCLKEGLTVYRDQEFSADMRSRAVERIGDVITLRAAQFAEDSGPLAHPVRPQSYREINNFYTATVYEKGAELVRMIACLIGPEKFRASMDLYFQRCDGTAATVEDFLACFGEAGGLDVVRFSRWYEQAGTPVVVAKGHHDAAARTYRLDLTQSTPATPGQPTKLPVVIPIRLGLIGADGQEFALKLGGKTLQNPVVTLDGAQASFVFEDITSPPTPSLLRGFSAPVRLEIDLGDEDFLHLLRHDSDPFNRWQAAQSAAMQALRRSVRSIREGGTPVHADGFITALKAFVAAHARQDHAFAALILTLPSENDIARDAAHDVDPDAIRQARETLRRDIGATLAEELADLHASLASSAPYSPDAASTGRRKLAAAALGLLAAGDAARGEALAAQQFATADNMTERLSALAVLTSVPGTARESALQAFHDRYRDEPLVLDKWLMLQATIAEPDVLERIARLMALPFFSLKNPNRVRSVIGGFANGNPTQFNRADGRGFDFVADSILALDAINPQVAARLATAFRTWRALEPRRQAAAKRALEKISAAGTLSRDLSDIVQRSLLER